MHGHGYQYSGHYTRGTIQDTRLHCFTRIASAAWLAGKDKSLAAIAMVFVHPSQILLDDMHMLEHSAFKSLRLPVCRENCKQITDVIVPLYKDKLQSAKTGNTYERTNLGIL